MLIGRVLITGSNGFVGRNIANELLKKYSVIGVSLHKTNLTGLPITYLQADLSDSQSLERLNNFQFDAIIHCAASISMDNNDPRLIDTNLRGTLNVINLAKHTGCRHFIYLSSVQVIGIPVELPIDETHLIYPRTFYHLTKYIGETYLEQAVEDFPSTVLRLSSPIGAGMPVNRFLPFIIKQCLKNEPLRLLGKGGRVQNYIDISDIARAVVQVLDTAKTGLFNLVSTHSYSNLEVTEICIRTLQSASKISFGGDDPEENHKWVFSTEKIRNVLGFCPDKSLERTIKEISSMNHLL